MSFSLTENPNQLFSKRTSEYFEPGYCRVVDAHLAWLRNRRGTANEVVTAIEAYRFVGDLYGLLHHKRIDPILWYATMRLSGLDGPLSITESLRTLVIPSPSDCNQLMEGYKKNKR